MNIILKLLLSALSILVTSYLLNGVYLDDFVTAIVLAIVLTILNYTVKPLLIVLTIPLTVVTLGLFLLIINAIVILIADSLISGFRVDSFWWALGFSVIVAIINSFLNDLNRSKN
ncbi:MAG: phage holin family protein [Bacteroidota bacterium]